MLLTSCKKHDFGYKIVSYERIKLKYLLSYRCDGSFTFEFVYVTENLSSSLALFGNEM